MLTEKTLELVWQPDPNVLEEDKEHKGNVNLHFRYSDYDKLRKKKKKLLLTLKMEIINTNLISKGKS